MLQSELHTVLQMWPEQRVTQLHHDFLTFILIASIGEGWYTVHHLYHQFTCAGTFRELWTCKVPIRIRKYILDILWQNWNRFWKSIRRNQWNVLPETTSSLFCSRVVERRSTETGHLANWVHSNCSFTLILFYAIKLLISRRRRWKLNSIRMFITAAFLRVSTILI